MTDLSILCVTRLEPFTEPFLENMLDFAKRVDAEFVLAIDCDDVVEAQQDVTMIRVHSRGFIESVLDEAIAACSRPYVLRLDDDERCSSLMERWIENRAFETANHWRFPRVHLWGDTEHALLTAHLYPDWQTRLSVKHMAGGRHEIHAGSPYGGGLEAPCAIEHHKFLVKKLEERRAMVHRYEQLQQGAGTPFRAWNTPEEFYTEEELAESIRGWDGVEFSRKVAS